jgi:hypothetical protein
MILVTGGVGIIGGIFLDWLANPAASCGDGIELKSENILPIPATDYPVPAARPYNSRLSIKSLKKPCQIWLLQDNTPIGGNNLKSMFLNM